MKTRRSRINENVDNLKDDLDTYFNELSHTCTIPEDLPPIDEIAEDFLEWPGCDGYDLDDVLAEIKAMFPTLKRKYGRRGMNENRKITLTLGQLKRLVRESTNKVSDKEWSKLYNVASKEFNNIFKAALIDNRDTGKYDGVFLSPTFDVNGKYGKKILDSLESCVSELIADVGLSDKIKCSIAPNSRNSRHEIGINISKMDD